MGIQFKQIDNLENTFSSMSGSLQTQISANGEASTGVLSGDSVFGGWKYFTGNVDFSGAQGILVGTNSIYTPNNLFAGAIKVGYPINSPRNSTPGPGAALRVSGGSSYFEGEVNLTNGAGLNVNEGWVSGSSGSFNHVTGQSGYFGRIVSEGIEVSGSATGIVRLLDLPTGTGTLSSGELFRSGNHLMIV